MAGPQRRAFLSETQHLRFRYDQVHAAIVRLRGNDIDKLAIKPDPAQAGVGARRCKKPVIVASA